MRYLITLIKTTSLLTPLLIAIYAMILIALIAIAMMVTACGFASDDPCTTVNTTVTNPTKYKKLYVSGCHFRIDVETYIEDKYSHWKENIHHMSAKFGNDERAEYTLWNGLGVDIPCGACLVGLTGMLSVMDSRMHLVPWGCGPERPPLNILNIHTSYTDKDGAVDIADAESAPWEDTPLPIYNYDFMPKITSSPEVCSGEPVLLDLLDACEVLVQAGALE